MRIFGRTWDEEGDVGRQYIKGRLPGNGPACYVWGNHDRELYYRCKLCRAPYRQWLCADNVWKRLPEALHKMTLCPWCFVAIRTYTRMMRAG